MKILKYLLIVLVCIVVVGALVLGYLGLLPGVASVFGSNKPRDLGVSYSDQDATAAFGISGVAQATLPSSTPAQTSIQYTGTHALTASFSQEQISALVNEQQWKYYPVQAAQIKFNTDGTVEFSGLLLKDRLSGYTQAMGGSAIDVSGATKYIAGNPPIYIKGKAEVVNNVFTVFDIQKAEVGRLDVTKYATKYRSDVMSYVTDRIQFVPGLEVTSAKIEGGKFLFDGSLYDTKATVDE